MPLSSTETTTKSRSRRARVVTQPSLAVNFTAFDMRLRRICFIARRSTWIGMPSAMPEASVMFFSAAIGVMIRVASLKSSVRSTVSTERSTWPASMRLMSRMSLMTPRRYVPEWWMSPQYSSYFGAPSGPNIDDFMISEKPMIAFSGVRSS